MFFFLIIFIDDLGLQKFTINPQRHGSPSRDLIADRSEDYWEVQSHDQQQLQKSPDLLGVLNTFLGEELFFFLRCRGVSYL